MFRYNPTRLGLVFYQHQDLIYAHHGAYEYESSRMDNVGKRYEAWKKGSLPLTQRQLKEMEDLGLQISGFANKRRPESSSPEP